MTVKVLVISSSPRTGGNTDILADEAVSGAKESGAEVAKIVLKDLEIRPCKSCGYCQSKGECIIQDDMQLLYVKFLEFNRIVLASPIYFMAHCAQAKIVIDRCQMFWSRKYVLKVPVLPNDPQHERIGAFVSCGATRGDQVFRGAKLTMKYFYDVLEAKYSENILYNQADEKGSVREHPGALNEACELGRRLAKP